MRPVEALLHLAPALLLLVPLLLGRFPGEEKLASIRRGLERARPRAPRALGRPRLSLTEPSLGGGRLVAVSLLGRGPPVPAMT